MKIRTPEEIANITVGLEGRANITAINRLYREQDESHLFPIHGEFNATERAIRKAREYARENGAVYGLEYAYMLEELTSKIVNREILTRCYRYRG